MFHKDRKSVFLIKKLGLKGSPIGVSLLKSDLPKDIKRPLDRCTFCEAVTLAQRENHAIGITKDDLDCPFALATLGFQEFPKEEIVNLIKSGQFGPHTLEFLQAVPSIPVSIYKSIIVGPPEKMPTKPDVVLLIGSSVQMTKLLNAWMWIKGKPLHVNIQGVGTICSGSVANAYKKGEPAIAFPCIGARELGGFKAEEAVFTSPYAILGELIEGLKEMEPSPEDIEDLVLKLLRTKGGLTTRAIIIELVGVAPRCPDRLAYFLTKMQNEGKIKREFSAEKRGHVWRVK